MARPVALCTSLRKLHFRARSTATVGLAALALAITELCAGSESQFHRRYTGTGWIQGITRDGERLVVVDRHDERVILRDWRTGTEKRFAATAFQALLSPDGKRIALMRPGAALLVLDADGPETQSGTPALKVEGARNISAWAWSSDGSQLLSTVAARGTATRVLIVSPPTGQTREVGSIEDGPAEWGITFAPDGASILYNTTAPVRTGENSNNIRLLSSAGSLVPDVRPWNYYTGRPLWTADFRAVSFERRNGNSRELWLQPYRGDSPAGRAERMIPNLGDRNAIGFGTNGDLYLTSTVREPDHILIENFESASLPAGARRLTPGSQPVFSPDGKRIAFRTGEGRNVGIQVREIDSGAIENFPAPAGITGPMHWFPDGSALLVSVSNSEKRMEFHRMNLRDASATRLVVASLLNSVSVFASPAELATDGASLFYIIRDNAQSNYRLMKNNLASVGEERMGIFEFPPAIGWSISPNGRMIATQVRYDDGSVGVRVSSLDGNHMRELLRSTRLSDFQKFNRPEWSQDGQFLYIVMADEKPPYNEVWKLPTDGGPAIGSGVRHISLRDPRLTPDGRSIAFSGGDTERGIQHLWVAERAALSLGEQNREAR